MLNKHLLDDSGWITISSGGITDLSEIIAGHVTVVSDWIMLLLGGSDWITVASCDIVELSVIIVEHVVVDTDWIMLLNVDTGDTFVDMVSTVEISWITVGTGEYSMQDRLVFSNSIVARSDLSWTRRARCPNWRLDITTLLVIYNMNI